MAEVEAVVRPLAQPSGLWRNLSFVLLFASQTISLLGSGATTIGVALLAYQMEAAGSATAVVGNASTLRILAFLLLSQLTGTGFRGRVGC